MPPGTAGARNVEVTLEGDDVGSLLLRISDDGSGIEPDALASSAGFSCERCAPGRRSSEPTWRRAPDSSGTVLELWMPPPTRR